ncbi:MULTISPECIES: hypothetical protein [unclassified Coleofasciculus]|nr:MULTISPECIES: hypothetical protein [unclassified Coleofasciculus]
MTTRRLDAVLLSGAIRRTNSKTPAMVGQYSVDEENSRTEYCIVL